MQKILIGLTILAGIILLSLLTSIVHEQNVICEKLEMLGDNYCDL